MLPFSATQQPPQIILHLPYSPSGDGGFSPYSAATPKNLTLAFLPFGAWGFYPPFRGWGLQSPNTHQFFFQIFIQTLRTAFVPLTAIIPPTKRKFGAVWCPFVDAHHTKIQLL